MIILEEYLKYLNEDKPGLFSKFFSKADIKGNAVSGVKTSIFWGIVVTPAIILSWRLAKDLLSNAVRKCGGGIGKNTPGFKVCVAREKIKAFQKKMEVSNSLLMKCNTSKNAEVCKQKAQLEIEKCKNRIEIEQNRVREILGEQENIQEFLPMVSGIAINIAAMMGADKVLNSVFRAAQALFSKAARQCDSKEDGPQRDMCISKIKLIALNKQLSVYNQLSGSCMKQKNPESCKKQINSKMMKLKRDIQIQKDSILAYNREIIISQKEEELRKTPNLKK